MAKMTGSANYSMKQVTVTEEEVNRFGKEEPFLSDEEIEEELVDKVPVPICMK